ncbi:MFS transporter [Leptospira andrefontaineae]|uniref:MFS transporter n=1 Tax=Leptospira andrefontaineae TaxID=2484976 RepID=A0A4V6QKY0_9LEPT|nr:MFS transporter [Leptospira andrefontaineae]TGK36654.1 MFS transporter [Leptospira andrefontaineae]
MSVDIVPTNQTNTDFGYESVKLEFKNGPPRWVAPRDLSFLFVAFAFIVVMLGTTLPTPLYVFYQRKLGFSTFMSTMIFSAYSFGVLVALILFGRASDTVGRRPILLLGLVCSFLSSSVFLGANELTALFVGRVFSGLSAGIFTGTATATLVDLTEQGGSEHASLVATLANMGGLGLGPLMAGLLAEYYPSPLLLPFKFHLGLLLFATIGLWVIPEPILTKNRLKFSIVRLAIPLSMRSIFIKAATAGFAGFAVLGLFTAVVPLFLSKLLMQTSPALSGYMACSIFVASAIGQITLGRSLGNLAIPVGCALLMIGMVFFSTSLITGSIVFLSSTAIVAGLGQGVILRASIAAINEKAPQEKRASIASSFFLILYLAISLPVIGVGFGADIVGFRFAGIFFSCVVIFLSVIALIAILHTKRIQ